MNRQIPGAGPAPGSSAPRRIRPAVVKRIGFGSTFGGTQAFLLGSRCHSSAVRPTAPCGPCRGEPPEWRDRHGCASEAGSRGSWPDAGCSAEKYACSRQYLQIHFRFTEPASRLGGTPTARTSDSSGTEQLSDSEHSGRAHSGSERSTAVQGCTASGASSICAEYWPRVRADPRPGQGEPPLHRGGAARNAALCDRPGQLLASDPTSLIRRVVHPCAQSMCTTVSQVGSRSRTVRSESADSRGDACVTGQSADIAAIWSQALDSSHRRSDPAARCVAVDDPTDRPAGDHLGDRGPERFRSRCDRAQHGRTIGRDAVHAVGAAGHGRRHHHQGRSDRYAATARPTPRRPGRRSAARPVTAERRRDGDDESRRDGHRSPRSGPERQRTVPRFGPTPAVRH